MITGATPRIKTNKLYIIENNFDNISFQIKKLKQSRVPRSEVMMKQTDA